MSVTTGHLRVSQGRGHNFGKKWCQNFGNRQTSHPPVPAPTSTPRPASRGNRTSTAASGPTCPSSISREVRRPAGERPCAGGHRGTKACRVKVEVGLARSLGRRPRVPAEGRGRCSDRWDPLSAVRPPPGFRWEGPLASPEGGETPVPPSVHPGSEHPSHWCPRRRAANQRIRNDRPKNPQAYVPRNCPNAGANAAAPASASPMVRDDVHPTKVEVRLGTKPVNKAPTTCPDTR